MSGNQHVTPPCYHAPIIKLRFKALCYLASTEFIAIFDPPQDVFRRLHELRLLHDT